MNPIGVMVYAFLAHGTSSWGELRQVIETELPLPYDVLPTEDAANALWPFAVWAGLSVVPIAEAREAGRIGLYTIDDATYRRSTERLRRVDGPEAGTWIEALRLPNGERLIAPQFEGEDSRACLFAPVVGPRGQMRLLTLDTGIRAFGQADPGSIVMEPCGRGTDAELNWTCVPGTCTGRCEPDGWVSGDGPIELTGCTCT